MVTIHKRYKKFRFNFKYTRSIHLGIQNKLILKNIKVLLKKLIVFNFIKNKIQIPIFLSLFISLSEIIEGQICPI